MVRNNFYVAWDNPYPAIENKLVNFKKKFSRETSAVAACDAIIETISNLIL